MAVLSHAMLFIASLIASPIGISNAHANVDSCHESAWQPANEEVRVHGYVSLRTREVASVRVLGRCVVKNAPEDAQPVLYVPFGSPLDNPDDQDLADARAETRPQFGHPAAPGMGPVDLCALLESVVQLERPPRV